MKLWRPVFYPNGITLSSDGNLLFIADMLGVIRMDLRTNDSADVDPGAHDTLSGVDGLYWHSGELLGTHYGAGEYRVMRWKLSPNSRKVTRSGILEYRTSLTSDPTTGAILGDNFYSSKRNRTLCLSRISSRIDLDSLVLALHQLTHRPRVCAGNWDPFRPDSISASTLLPTFVVRIWLPFGSASREHSG